MAHRDPSSPSWALARRSKALWEQLAAGGGQQQQQQQPGGGTSSGALQAALEWQANGSLLLATTDIEVQALQARARMLRGQGVAGVVLLSPREMQMLEPALQLPAGSRGLLVKSDAQIVSEGVQRGRGRGVSTCGLQQRECVSIREQQQQQQHYRAETQLFRVWRGPSCCGVGIELQTGSQHTARVSLPVV